MFVGAFPGRWDYTLGLVMAGAVAISLLAFSLTPYASVRPWFAPTFVWPRRADVDAAGFDFGGAVVEQSVQLANGLHGDPFGHSIKRSPQLLFETLKGHPH